MAYFAKEFITSFNWFIRSLKKGDWIWLMVAIIIASTTVTIVKQLGDTVQQSMLRKAAVTLGADLVIKSTRPINTQWQRRAQALGLKTQEEITLTTMALINRPESEPGFQMIQLKAISDLQPLRGKRALNPIDNPRFNNRDSNEMVWLSSRLQSIQDIQSKDTLTLGTKTFTVAGSIQGINSLNPMQSIAPQAVINIDNINKIGLIGPGSRVSYQLMVAGDKQSLTAFYHEISKAKHTEPSWQIISAETPSPDLGNALDKAWIFLDLAALSAVMVAGMSILIASRFYLARWKQSIALMRAYGAHNAKMNRLFAMQMTWVAILSSFVGVVLGYLISIAFSPILNQYFTPLVQPEPFKALIIGFLSGLLVLWAFAWQAFYSTIKTAPMNVLKSVSSANQNIRHWLVSFILLLVLISVMLEIGNLHWVILGISVIGFTFYLVSIVFLKLLHSLQKHSLGWFKIALSNITRESNLVKIQLTSIGMVLFFLMLLTFVRQDIMQNWQASLPSNTPNAFAVNIQSSQKTTVDKILVGVEQKTDSAMVRGRLVKVNGQAIRAEHLATERGKRLLRREANIAVMPSLPKHNTILSSLDTKQLTHPKVSVEQSIADEFGLRLGDVLEFNISGQNYAYQISSLRAVTWQSFQLNFFFIFEPVTNRNLPISYISNFKIIDQQPGLIDDHHLTKQFAEKVPGVLFFDVRKILNQIQDIMNQASWAVTVLFSFTFAASLIVLFTATLASQQARIQGWFLLRTLGAENSTILKIGLTEFVFLGALSGLLAATLAQFVSIIISVYMLDLTAQIDVTLWITSITSGALIFFVIGLMTQWNYLNKSTHELKKFIT